MPAIRALRANLKSSFPSFAFLSFLGPLLLTATAVAQSPRAAAHPDLGPNVLLFDPSIPAGNIQAQIDKVYSIQQHSEFGSARYALLFLPGEYHVDIPVGFYTQVLGLGATPDAVHIIGNGSPVAVYKGLQRAAVV